MSNGQDGVSRTGKPAAKNKSNTDVDTQPAKKTKHLTKKQVNALLIDSGEAIHAALQTLEKARELATLAGLSVDSHILGNEITSGSNNNSTNGTGLGNELQAVVNPKAVIRSNFTTGGHSNTDHVVVRTGDVRKDRIAELKRNLVRRARAMQPENRGDGRWDKPRRFGERRRRIIREMDRPDAPPEPPLSGYVLFVKQMTTKIRHDRPNVRHDQSKVMQEISKIWRLGMSQADREYYNDMSLETKKEYDQQQIEFRATGSFTASTNFHRLEEANVWLHTKWEEKNGLEQEISNYDNFLFPKRPPEYDKQYERNLIASRLRRKLKLRGFLNEDGTVKVGADPDLVREYENALGTGETPSDAEEPGQDKEGGRDRGNRDGNDDNGDDESYVQESENGESEDEE